ncbi:MAG: molybdenum cofactor biosynthesis protein [Candidatus Omnitrophica bacterium CG1_02_44_16]|nr:MAG: molybdenum cofactor biosynthesis protein [Candidatus Omnitrophica bacterium CG1_02_44_16]PIY82289.1 MAG: molybdenum cofactor biosynthesis protein [Candidatus Omnitrophica bacterium CG_4_10_14_0_8_um_filter_44_12]PIZ84583.1 MAG: molybdenum cofactor biosynthesis protein [Candidatus Omnitrophica bacterium CG_4_10_14_0_2_um_filter_44_9]
MKSSSFKGITAAVLTVSDSCAKGAREDVSGKALARLLKARGARVLREEIVEDSKKKIAGLLKFIADELKIKLILTTGGTGLSSRDVTPEATKEVIEREAPGIAELLRLEGFRHTKYAVLSRSVAGVRKNTLIINLPGSPRGSAESFEIIADIIPHAFAMISGEGH